MFQLISWTIVCNIFEWFLLRITEFFNWSARFLITWVFKVTFEENWLFYFDSILLSIFLKNLLFQITRHSPESTDWRRLRVLQDIRAALATSSDDNRNPFARWISQKSKVHCTGNCGVSWEWELTCRSSKPTLGSHSSDLNSSGTQHSPNLSKRSPT